MVHRDIKPANLMLTQKGDQQIIKVLDFGLSKATLDTTILDPDQPSSTPILNVDGSPTIYGQMLGTPDYIAPEQINDAQSADIRADIYSLGCTLYYLLSGRRPFLAETLYDLLQAHQSMSAEPLNFVRPDVPTELAALVAKMMAKEPARRFQTPGEVAQALEPFFRKKAQPSLSISPVVASPREPAPEIPIEIVDRGATAQVVPSEEKPVPVLSQRRRPWKWAAVAMGSVSVCAVALWIVTSRLNTNPEPPAHPGIELPLDPPPPPPPPPLPDLPDIVFAPEIAPPPPEPRPDPVPLKQVIVARLTPLGEQVERAIRDGVRYLKQQQRADGSWEDSSQQAKTGTTSLVTLALLTAGEKPDSPTIRQALTYLRRFGPEALRSTYAIALQTMVFAAAEPQRDWLRIGANEAWLESAQIKPPRKPSGCWTYNESPQGGDNSNTQYALLGLSAASEVGVPVKPEVWALARLYWENIQHRDGGWGYHDGDQFSTSSMTCAGISSLVITGSKRFQGAEYLQGALIHNCGQGATHNLQSAIDWLGGNSSVGQNFPMGQQWKYYFLYGLERAGRFAGVRFFGRHDWYRLGAEELVHSQDRLSGFWRGATEQPVVATSFALLFLAKGRAPVLVNKLRHGHRGDWNHDPDDVRNLVAVVSRDRKRLLTWQIIDPAVASVADLLLAPIVFLNGHRVPELNAQARQKLHDFLEQGGFLLADACCGDRSFDIGFKELMKEIFPAEPLRPLADDHRVWIAKNRLTPSAYPLWGIEHGGRTVVIYSPKDLSCYWNQVERSSTNSAVILATKVGQNIVEYMTGGKNPLDKLTVREVRNVVVGNDVVGNVVVGNEKDGNDVVRNDLVGNDVVTDVKLAIQNGIRFLKKEQKGDGSWADVNRDARTGTTSLVTLALLAAGEKPHSPIIAKATDYLRTFAPDQLNSTYAVALQTMVFAAAEPDRDRPRIAANVSWLESAQIKPGETIPGPGSWSYTSSKRGQPGDNSNSQYALLGLDAASEVGVPVKPEVWALARAYWEKTQRGDGGWAYRADSTISTSSMTCAGISSLVITGSKRFQGVESIDGVSIHNCGQGANSPNRLNAYDWLAGNLAVGQNFPMGQQWKHYFLYGLERAGRLEGIRFFGQHDWYRRGAEELVRTQDRLSGFWRGSTEQPVLATSFALMFLAKGRAPVLIYKLRLGSKDDLNNDADDMRNLVAAVSRDRKTLLTWQYVHPSIPVTDVLPAPIVFFNGHVAPAFDAVSKKNLRRYVDQGGFILADACCSAGSFDSGFKALMKEIFPEAPLRPLVDKHRVWRAKHLLSPGVYPLQGIEHGGRTVVVYSPKDLSCYWNQAEHSSTNNAVILATKVGENIVEYVTGGKNPLDKLIAQEVRNEDPSPAPIEGSQPNKSKKRK